MTQAPAGRDFADVDVVIVTFQSARWIEACVASVRRQLPGAGVHIFDNASWDGTWRIVSRLPNVTATRYRRNHMLSPIWNDMLRRSSARFLLLLNPDAEIKSAAFLERGREAIAADQRVVMAGRVNETTLGEQFDFDAPVRPADKFTFFEAVHRFAALAEAFASGAWREVVIRRIDGACVLLDREAILALSGFRDDLPLYFNDTELSLRLQDRGRDFVEVWSRGDGQVEHALYGSSERRLPDNHFTLRETLLHIALVWRRRFARLFEPRAPRRLPPYLAANQDRSEAT
ncbi:MAG: glycosyltransferase [Candidatus Lernaella stagnicola]|nr:glycosyltransferase [Candidatus Lernaella stagnicola]